MINFDKLFNQVMKENHITIYRLYTYLGISKSQIYRIKAGKCQLATLNTMVQDKDRDLHQLNLLSLILEFLELSSYMFLC